METSHRVANLPLNDDIHEVFASHHSTDREEADAHLAAGGGLWNKAGKPVVSRVASRRAELAELQAERDHLVAEIRDMERGVA